jgi:glutaredoxin-like protein
MYTTNWCPDCIRAKRYLEKFAIPFIAIDIDLDKEARGYVKQVNGGKVIIPTIVFPDGSILMEPSNIELKAKLHL